MTSRLHISEVTDKCKISIMIMEKQEGFQDIILHQGVQQLKIRVMTNSILDFCFQIEDIDD